MSTGNTIPQNAVNRLAEGPKDPTQVPDPLKDDVGKTPGDFIDETEEDGDDDMGLDDDADDE